MTATGARAISWRGGRQAQHGQAQRTSTVLHRGCGRSGAACGRRRRRGRRPSGERNEHRAELGERHQPDGPGLPVRLSARAPQRDVLHPRADVRGERCPGRPSGTNGVRSAAEMEPGRWRTSSNDTLGVSQAASGGRQLVKPATPKVARGHRRTTGICLGFGLAPGATDEEIRAAYVQLARVLGTQDHYHGATPAEQGPGGRQRASARSTGPGKCWASRTDARSTTPNSSTR